MRQPRGWKLGQTPWLALLALLLPIVAACSSTTTTNPTAAPGSTSGASGAPQSLEKVTFALDFVINGRHAPYFLAKEKGYYRDEGLDVDIVRGIGSADSINRVASGRAQFAFGDIASLVEARANNNVPVKAVAVVYGKAPYSIIYRGDAGINAPKDLEGKTIYAGTGDAIRRVFPAFAQASGIDASKITWEAIDPAARQASLFAGRAPITTEYSVAKPLYDKLGKAQTPPVDVKFMAYSDFGVDIYSNAILVSEQTLKDKPELIKKFLRATIKGLDESFRDPDATVDILTKFQPELDKDLIKPEVEIVKSLAQTPEAQQNGTGYMSPDRIKKTIDSMTRAFDLKVTVRPEDLYANDFLPKKS